MIRKFFAGIFNIVFLYTGMLGIFLCALLLTYLNPAFYTKEFFEKSYDVVMPSLSWAAQQNEETIRVIEKIRGNFTKEDFANFSKKFFDQTVEQLSTAFHPDNLAALQSLKISLGVARDELRTHVEKFASQMPDCTAGQSPGEDSCLPKGVPAETRAVFVKSFGHEITKGIPEEATIKLPEMNYYLLRGISDLFHNRRELWIAILGTLLFTFLLPGLIIHKPFKSVLKWEGSLLFIFALGMAALVFGSERFFDFLPEKITPPVEIRQAILFFNGPVLSLLKVWVISLGIAGIVLFLFGIFLRTQPAKNQSLPPLAPKKPIVIP